MRIVTFCWALLGSLILLPAILSAASSEYEGINSTKGSILPLGASGERIMQIEGNGVVTLGRITATSPIGNLLVNGVINVPNGTINVTNGVVNVSNGTVKAYKFLFNGSEPKTCQEGYVLFYNAQNKFVCKTIAKALGIPDCKSKGQVLSFDGTDFVCESAAPAATCTPTSQTRIVSCPTGYTGTITQQQNYTCSGTNGTWEAWYDIGNSCAVIPAPPAAGSCVVPGGAHLFDAGGYSCSDGNAYGVGSLVPNGVSCSYSYSPVNTGGTEYFQQSWICVSSVTLGAGETYTFVPPHEN